MVDDVPENGPNLDVSAWQLIDPRPIQQENPYTFFVPSDAEKAALVPGDLVKLMFRSLSPHNGTERMWVTFQGRDEVGAFGQLDNQPLDIPGLTAGDIIRFQDHHIVSVWEPKVDDISHEDRMFARCHVDPRILNGGARIGRIERRSAWRTWRPWRKDRWPDTGWYIYANDNTRPRSRDMRYVAIGVVLNQDDSIRPYLSAAPGSRMIRDGDRFRDI